MMNLKIQPAVLCMFAALALGLTACSGSEDASDAASESAQMGSAGAPEGAGATLASYSMADGSDVCFRAIAKQLGADIKVSEISSYFSVGKEIDPSETKPAGEMKSCTVQYQNPKDSRKLLSTRLDLASGEFTPPSPVEISVMGNAADFRLEDYLIPLSRVDAAALTSVMEAQKARLDDVYGQYAWSGIRLAPPGPFSATHMLRIDLTGRLAANDIKGNGFALVTTDGKKIAADYLMP